MQRHEWAPNQLGSDQKLPEESTDSPDSKPWKTWDNSSPQAVRSFPQGVSDGETGRISPSLSFHSTTHRLQKRAVTGGFGPISPVSTRPTTAVLVVLLREEKQP